MALEQVFSCPRTLAKLRDNPLGGLLEGFCRWLLDGGFTRGCVRKHLCYASHLNQYLGCATDPPREKLSAQDVEEETREETRDRPRFCASRPRSSLIR